MPKANAVKYAMIATRDIESISWIASLLVDADCEGDDACVSDGPWAPVVDGIAVGVNVDVDRDECVEEGEKDTASIEARTGSFYEPELSSRSTLG
jgi:hypothetical protein